MIDRTRFSRRSPALRAFALVSALVLLLAGATDAYGLHRCAHHDSLPGAPEASTEGHGAGHDHGARTDGAQPGHEDAGCTCVGDCAGSPGIESKPVASPVALHFAIRVVAGDTPTDALRVAHSPHFLPFAQAPPLDR